MKFSIFQGSRQGPRPYNQDRLAYSYNSSTILMVLADGMGGHQFGEMAAEIAVKTLADAFQRLAKPSIASPAKFLTDHILQVHQVIENVRVSKNLPDSPRTTLVAAIVQNNTLYCAHVGDSRLYHFRKGHLLFRTEDHSVVQALFRKGQISREEMVTHPHKNKIFNCLGGDKTPEIDLSDRMEVEDGDIIMLCTDGVWNVVGDKDIKNTLFAGEIKESVTELLNLAEKASEKVGDNMSAIGLLLGDRPNNPETISTVPFGETTTIVNPVNSASSSDLELSDDEIERTIAEIQAALNRTQPFKKP